MLIDYLRYLAYAGPLRTFFDSGLYRIVDPEQTSGQHLRFSRHFLRRRMDQRYYNYHPYWDGEGAYYKSLVEKLKDEFDIVDDFSDINSSTFDRGNVPPTRVFKAFDASELEIVVDINPEHWSNSFLERRSYENVSIIFRKIGPARFSSLSGDKLVDRRYAPSRYGTICGFFSDGAGQVYALTCGHVAVRGSEMQVENSRKIWGFKYRSEFSTLGITSHYSECEVATGTPTLNAPLDAALVSVVSEAVQRYRQEPNYQFELRPTSTMIQEDDVYFRGARSGVSISARVAAVTVRKSMRLYDDSTLRTVGDVLMLGHQQPLYIRKSLSLPGDSGSAVCKLHRTSSPHTSQDEWHAMIIGADDCGSYASYAENLWGWASNQTGSADLDFSSGVGVQSKFPTFA